MFFTKLKETLNIRPNINISLNACPMLKVIFVLHIYLDKRQKSYICELSFKI